MSSVDVLKKAENAVAGLSDRDRRKLLKKFSMPTETGIEKDPEILGGSACVRQTRIPVWLIYRARQLGLSEGDLLKSYPGLTAEDLVNAWSYAALNLGEIEAEIASNESDI